MTNFCTFALKKEIVWTARMVIPITETRNVIGVCMYPSFAFPDIKYLFGALKICGFWTSTLPINNKTCRVSWNLVIKTLEDTTTNATHIFWEKFVTISWNKINHFAILKHLYLNTLLPCQLYQLIKRFRDLCWEFMDQGWFPLWG